VTTARVPTRSSLEASVAAVASSVDGRRFTFQWSIHDLSVKVGGYASLDGRLGQVHAVEAAWVEGAALIAAVTEEVTDASHLRIALARRPPRGRRGPVPRRSDRAGGRDVRGRVARPDPTAANVTRRR
jgi:hypothetical protein